MAEATPPPQVTSKRWLPLSFILAGILLIASLVQLVDFEAFALSIAAYEIGSSDNATTLAIILITAEIFSLPFLLRLWLSKLARIVSATFVLLAPLLWLTLLLQAAVRQLSVANTGFLGDMVPLALSPLTIALSVVGLAVGVACFIGLNARNAFKS